MRCERVLIVDDREENLAHLEALLSSNSFEIQVARHGREALDKARLNRPHVVISDLLMPVMDGFTLLRDWRGDSSLARIPFIIYTSTYTDPGHERLAFNLGADAFILKPTEPDVFLARLQELLDNTKARGAVERRKSNRPEVTPLKEYSETLIRKLEEKCLELEKANRTLHKRMVEEREFSGQAATALDEHVGRALLFEEFIGSSMPLKKVLSSVAKVAPMETTVLITGESGTGKELIARAIHKYSPRAGRPLVCVNCAALTPSLIASELFGHEKGAFTGADQRRLGRFDLAAGGTIFLDEIGDLPAEIQIALLRVLQERQFERVGGNAPITADVRVIAATNRDLKAAMTAGSFRVDLFYRLNVFPISVPPLRDRREDIPILLEYFIHCFGVKMRKKVTKMEKKSLDMICSHSWPGNIRELQNVAERSMILCEGDTFTVDERWLLPELNLPSTRILDLEVEQFEKGSIERALARCNGKVSGPLGAAAVLGIPSSTLESKLRVLKINKHSFVRDR